MNSLRNRVRYAAYRAPQGGMVVRGTYYPGGRMVPDMRGAFAQSQRVTAFREWMKSRLNQTTADRRGFPQSGRIPQTSQPSL